MENVHNNVIVIPVYIHIVNPLFGTNTGVIVCPHWSYKFILTELNRNYDLNLPLTPKSPIERKKISSGSFILEVITNLNKSAILKGDNLRLFREGRGSGGRLLRGRGSGFGLDVEVEFRLKLTEVVLHYALVVASVLGAWSLQAKKTLLLF